MSEQSETEGERPRLEIDWVKLVAGALAAVSSAFLLSTLGAVGTLIGTALGSIVVSVATAVYSTSIERSKQRMLTQPASRRQGGSDSTRAHPRVDPDTRTGADADGDASRDEGTRATPGVSPHTQAIPTITSETLGLYGDAPPSETDPGSEDAGSGEAGSGDAGSGDLPNRSDQPDDDRSWKGTLAALPWKSIALWAVGLFLAGLLVLTVIELATGKSASEITGGSSGDSGSSWSEWTGGGSSSDDDTTRPSRGDRDDESTSTPDSSATTSGDDEDEDTESAEPSATASSSATAGTTQSGAATSAPAATGTP